MMNKQVAAFLFDFLKDAALPKRFLMALLCETCNAKLVAEIQDCNWDKDMHIITTPYKKSQDHDAEDLETANRYKKAFDLKGFGKAAKPTTNKFPRALFNLDTKNSIKTIHNCHLKPTFTLEVEDKDSEVMAPAAIPSPATPPCKNSAKEAMSNNELLPTRETTWICWAQRKMLHGWAGGQQCFQRETGSRLREFVGTIPARINEQMAAPATSSSDGSSSCTSRITGHVHKQSSRKTCSTYCVHGKRQETA